MTEDDNTNGRNPSADREYIPSGVRKAGAEARVAEKKADEDWIHVDELIEATAASIKHSEEFEDGFRAGMEHGALTVLEEITGDEWHSEKVETHERG